jgi:hypothetical protein
MRKKSGLRAKAQLPKKDQMTENRDNTEAVQFCWTSICALKNNRITDHTRNECGIVA